MDTRRDAGERLIGLELLRFLAALGVLVWHYQHFMFAGHQQVAWDWGQLPFRLLFAPFYTYGYAGVQLFWCISGFIFTWKYGGLIGRTGLSFGRFAMLRFSRLYPLHLAMLLTVAGLQYLYNARYGETFVYLFNDVPHFIMNLGFANWWGFQSGESFNGPSWSVSAEILIYVVFFWVTRRAGSGWRIDLWTLLAFSIAAPVAKALFGIKLAFTGAGTFFYLGALTCQLYQWIEMPAADPRLTGAQATTTPGTGRPALEKSCFPRRRFAWACAALIGVCAVLVDMHGLKIAGASLVMFPAAVLLVQLVVRPVRRPTRAWLTGLGNLTYASYMLHFPMQLATVLVLGALSVPVRGLVYSDWFMLSYLGIVFAAAFAAYHLFERPAQAWLRGRGRSGTASTGSVAWRN